MKNFIIFDDGAYTGTQLLRYLDSLHGQFLHYSNSILSYHKNIYFILGYFNENKYNQMINSDKILNFSKYGVNIKIISNVLIKNCQAIMQEEGLSIEFQSQINDLSSSNKLLLTTEWKRPDFVSTSVFTTRGLLRNYHRARYGELTMKSSLAVEDLDGISPIATIIPPYNKVNEFSDKLI